MARAMATNSSVGSKAFFSQLLTQSTKNTTKPGSNRSNKKKQNIKPEGVARIQSEDNATENIDEFSENIVHFYGQKCLKLWMIVMISLGQLPYSNRRERLYKTDKEFKKNYNKRIRFLKARTTTSPKDGLALCLPYHPATESDKKSEQHYDAVSALNLLRWNGYEIPPAVETMIDNLELIPLPPESHDPVPEDEKAKRDNSARIIAGMNKKMQILLIEMIRLHYKQPLTAQTMGDILQLMVKDLATTSIGRDGVKSQLELLLGTFESGA